MQKLDTLLNKANQLFKTGDLEAAVPFYRRVLALDAANLTALTSLGTIYLTKGDYEESAHCLKQALVLDPASFVANSNLGFIELHSGQYLEALKHLTAALQKEPRRSFLWNDMGKALDKLNRPAEAAECFQKAIAIDINCLDSYLSIASISIRLNKYHDAADYFIKAVSLNPEKPVLEEIYQNLCWIYYGKLGDIKKATDYAQMALAINPDIDLMKTTLVSLLLTQGYFSEGLDLYEKIRPRYFWTEIPRWHGEIFTDKRLIIKNDGVFDGFGDILLFARYVPLVKERGGHVAVFIKKELFRLFKSLHGADELLLPDGVIRDEDFDWQVPFINLPVIFKTSLATIPAQIPYLSVDPKLNAVWQTRLNHTQPDERTLKVGLTWACSNKEAANRTCDFDSFVPFGAIAGITYYNLQIGEHAKEYLQCECSGFEIIDLTGAIEDFADTAALIKNLDLVISVDTAVAHLTGAIGKPVWLLLHFESDWKWFTGRSDSPWYPSMRLFRSQTPGDWRGVVKEVCERLQKAVQNRELL